MNLLMKERKRERKTANTHNHSQTAVKQKENVAN